MTNLLQTKRAAFICFLLPLLATYAPLCAAQAGDCTAEVKIASIGVPPDDTRMRFRDLTIYRYRIDATTSDKQCVALTFNIRHSYKQRDGSTVTATEPGSLRVVGGKGSDFGELAEKRGLPKIEWTAEDLSCKRC